MDEAQNAQAKAALAQAKLDIRRHTQRLELMGDERESLKLRYEAQLAGISQEEATAKARIEKLETQIKEIEAATAKE